MPAMQQCWYMDFKIELWLKGYMFCSEALEIPEHDDRMVWQEQIEYRESLIDAAKIKMRALYNSQIAKCRGLFQIYIIAPSKIECQPFEYETDNGMYEQQNENKNAFDDSDRE